jgi:hypothetical protein
MDHLKEHLDEIFDISTVCSCLACNSCQECVIQFQTLRNLSSGKGVKIALFLLAPPTPDHKWWNRR